MDFTAISKALKHITLNFFKVRTKRMLVVSATTSRKERKTEKTEYKLMEPCMTFSGIHPRSCNQKGLISWQICDSLLDSKVMLSISDAFASVSSTAEKIQIELLHKEQSYNLRIAVIVRLGVSNTKRRGIGVEQPCNLARKICVQQC